MKYMIKKIIIGVCIALILSSIRSCDVNAAALLDVSMGSQAYLAALGFQGITRGEIANCTSSSSCNGTTYSSGALLATGKLGTRTTLNFSSSGYAYRFVANTNFKKDILYSVSGLWCFSKAFTPSGIKIYGGGSAQLGATYDSIWQARSVALTYQGTNDVDLNEPGVLNYCYTFATAFSTNSDWQSNWLNIQLLSSSGSMQTIMLGYNIEVLGTTNNLSSGTVQSIVNSQTTDLTNKINSQTASINSKMEQESNKVSNSVNQVNDSINDSSVDSSNTNSTLDGLNNNLPTNGTISSLILMPITLAQSYLNGMNSSCSTYSMGTILGVEISLPCINLSSLLGSSLITIIDILFSGFMIFAIGKKMVRVFNNFTNLKDGQINDVFGGGSE